MIGDMISDLLAGKNAGCAGNILVRTGHGQQQGDVASLASHVAEDLLEAARQIADGLMPARAVRVQYHQARGFAVGQAFLGDPLFGQVVIEFGQFHDFLG